MIQITVNKENVPLKNIWYNYKSRIRDISIEFSIVLELAAPEVQLFLRDFLGREVDLQNLIAQLLATDKKLGSLGFIWHLIRFFDKNIEFGVEDKLKPYYVFSCITKIEMEDSKLVIIGIVDLDDY